MKPTIPDTGTVIKLEGEHVVIRMKNDGSCRKCGAAAIGLCKGGFMQVLTANNSKRARVGDIVKIGLVQGVQFKGYLLAYVIPAAGLVLGAVGGHFLGRYTGFPSLDVMGGFFSLIVITFFSLQRLKRLDSSSSIEIVNVLASPRDPGSPKSDEENDLRLLPFILLRERSFDTEEADEERKRHDTSGLIQANPLLS